MHKKIITVFMIVATASPSYARHYDDDRIPYEKPNTQEEFIERVKQAHALSKDLRKIDHPRPFARLTRVVDAGVKTWLEKTLEQYSFHIIGASVGIIAASVALLAISSR